jgi:hypothetical protein
MCRVCLMTLPLGQQLPSNAPAEMTFVDLPLPQTIGDALRALLTFLIEHPELLAAILAAILGSLKNIAPPKR